MLQTREAHVFAATNERVGLRQLFEFCAQCKGVIERVSKALSFGARTKKLARRAVLAHCGQPGYLAFEQGDFDATNAGGFAGAINVGNRGLLKLVNGHTASAQRALQFYMLSKGFTADREYHKDLSIDSTFSRFLRQVPSAVLGVRDIVGW